MRQQRADALLLRAADRWSGAMLVAWAVLFLAVCVDSWREQEADHA
jgi:hypothetical protein